jgi:hypothetical protein
MNTGRRNTSATTAVLSLAACVGIVSQAVSAPVGPAIRSVVRIITGTTRADTFRGPVGLAADPTRGIFVVADTGRNRLVIFGAEGQSRGTLSLGSSEPRAPRIEPRAVALDHRGHVFLVEAGNPRVQVLSTRGKRLGEIDLPKAQGWGAGTRAQDVAVGASGRIYVLYGGERTGVAILGPSGSLESGLGFEAEEPRAFRGPVSLAVNDAETELAVLDPMADRVVLLYSTGGKLLESFGKHGDGEGTFSLATHVAWGPHETLWITDAVRHAISVCDSHGAYLGWIGGFGRRPGEFYYPAACAFLAPDRLVVLERAGARCQVLEVEVGGALVIDPGLEASVPQQTEQASNTRR